MSILAVYSCLFALIVEIKSNCDKGISQCPPFVRTLKQQQQGWLESRQGVGLESNIGVGIYFRTMRLTIIQSVNKSGSKSSLNFKK